MALISFLMTPAVMGSIALFLSIIWMLRDEKDKTRAMLVLALVLNLFFGFLLTVFMSKEGSMLPLKYDYVLFNLDKALGLQSAAIAAPLRTTLGMALFWVYELMVPVMIAWYLVAHYCGARGSVIVAYVAELILGPVFYAVLPACGPAYAFKPHWLKPWDVPAVPIHLTGMPNAFPSLHVATAFVFVLFAPRPLWRGISLVFLTGTLLATLATGEHYVIDLVAGLIFGCFAAALGHRENRKAMMFLSITAFWTLTIRFAWGLWIDHVILLRLFAGLSVMLAAATVFGEWTRHAVLPTPGQSHLATGAQATGAEDVAPEAELSQP
ncbi:MAG: phosphatase PAP2 family protein [Terracidiphilus sp.]